MTLSMTKANISIECHYVFVIMANAALLRVISPTQTLLETQNFDPFGLLLKKTLINQKCETTICQIFTLMRK